MWLAISIVSCPLGEKEAWERSGGDREWKSSGREGSLGAEWRRQRVEVLWERRKPRSGVEETESGSP